jgi:VIT1/CCC1 family predicted Fe2+/Mn2+ transporter
MSNLERFIRVIIGGFCLILPSYFVTHSYLSWTLTVIGLILILTGLTGFCPLYVWVFKRKAK